mmetsp:Transcript_2857/g.6030  ORF Transcript_2857/g.6030 Transcript_2857/m.6030 type:complete len:81 (+) Transcript_2857:219-461(+)
MSRAAEPAHNPGEHVWNISLPIIIAWEMPATYNLLLPFSPLLKPQDECAPSVECSPSVPRSCEPRCRRSCRAPAGRARPR